MSSTDSTIPDTSSGDSVGTQAGQGMTDKIKSAVKGNVGGEKETVPKDKTTKDVENASGGGLTGKTGGGEQNTLL
ncbi:MAG: hypothetical protein Q9164_003376 [Protoblastenia rupestris]